MNKLTIISVPVQETITNVLLKTSGVDTEAEVEFYTLNNHVHVPIKLETPVYTPCYDITLNEGINNLDFSKLLPEKPNLASNIVVEPLYSSLYEYLHKNNLPETNLILVHEQNKPGRKEIPVFKHIVL